LASAKIAALEITSEIDIEPRLEEIFVIPKHQLNKTKNLPQKHSETLYLLVSVDWILSALVAWFEQVDEYVKNFSFLWFQEMQRNERKTIENAVY